MILSKLRSLIIALISRLVLGTELVIEALTQKLTAQIVPFSLVLSSFIMAELVFLSHFIS